VIIIDSLIATEKITEYGVRWAGSYPGDEPVIQCCADLRQATRYAEKVNGVIMERVTYITEWEPYFGETASPAYQG
jgi:hypothetical protein